MAKPGSGDTDVAFDRTTPDEPGAPRREDAPAGGPIGSDATRDEPVHSDRVDGRQGGASPPDDLLQSNELPGAPRRPR